MEVHWKRLLETCCSWEMGIQYTTSSRGVVIMVVLDDILGGLRTVVRLDGELVFDINRSPSITNGMHCHLRAAVLNRRFR